VIAHARRFFPPLALARVGAGAARIALGSILVLHGLAQSVLALRGAGFIEQTPFGRFAGSVTWIGALIGLTAAGLGMLGVRGLRAIWRPAAVGGAIASIAGILLMGDFDLAPGAAIDVATITLALLVPVRPLRGGPIRTVLGLGFFAYLAIAALAHPFHRHWGARESELAMALPGDWPNRNAAYEADHAITIHAPPEAIWPWLAQMGQDRGGFYSYDTLENVAGLDIHSADRIHPEWQSRELGDLVRAAPPGWLGIQSDVGWTIDVFEPNRAFGMQGWGKFVLVPQPDGTTRLIARCKMGDPKFPAWGAVLNFTLLDLPHFVMERKQLLGIQWRAEHMGR
jgi:hypothetical protein